MAKDSKGWRAFALVYTYTFGLLISAVIVLIGTLYAVIDLVNALAGNSTFYKEFKLFMALTGSLKWMANLHRYAILGQGPGFEPLPDIDFL